MPRASWSGATPEATRGARPSRGRRRGAQWQRPSFSLDPHPLVPRSPGGGLAVASPGQHALHDDTAWLAFNPPVCVTVTCSLWQDRLVLHLWF